MDWSRAWRHLAAARRGRHRLLSAGTLERLRTVVADGEATHRAEVRLIVETALPFRKLARGLSPRQRALDLFGTFRVWDTEENNGVLLYIEVADRRLEVVADRAAARAIGDARWQAICATASEAFARGEFEDGVVAALGSIHETLAGAFPAVAGSAPRNELPDGPVVL